jgi:DNA-binding NarL/FixJ family response regulator
MPVSTAAALFVDSDARGATAYPTGARLIGRRILLADADSSHVLAVESTLAHHGAEVTVAQTRHAAQLASRARSFDAAIVALDLPGGGVRLVDLLRRQPRPCLAVMRAPQRGRAAALEIIGAGAVELLFSTHRVAVVVDAVERAVAATRRVREQLDAVDRPVVCVEACGAEPKRRLRAPAHGVRVEEAPTSRAATTDVDEAVRSLALRARLSPREQAVLRYLAIGYRYQDIGAVLEISARTVKMHATNMRQKVGVRSRHELLREMFERGSSCR